MKKTNPNQNHQKRIAGSSSDKKSLALKIICNSNGIVLVTALLLSAIIMILAIYIVQNLGTETNIAGSYKTNTKSLYVAEGGLEKVKAEIKTGQLSAFSFTGYSFGNSQEYIVNDTLYPMTTLTNPVNYVGTGTNWYVVKNPTTLALSGPLTASNATWPIYKSVSVGTDFAIVAMQRPRWYSSSPTKIRIPMTSEANNVQNSGLLNKAVAGDLELDYLNNLLTFNTFRDPADDVAFLDNNANDFVVIGSNPTEDHYGAGNDNGIDSGDTFITGVATFPKGNDRTLIIRKCAAGDVGSFTTCDSDPYIIPDMNSTNKTFIGGKVTVPSTQYYGKLLVAGACEDYSSVNEGSFTVDNGQRYKLDYVSSSTLPSGCEND